MGGGIVIFSIAWFAQVQFFAIRQPFLPFERVRSKWIANALERQEVFHDEK
jgi:hypothetical protein